MTTHAVPDVAIRRPAFTPIQRGRVKPVKWFAALGCGVLALTAYSLTRWLLGGHATPTPTGANDVPTYLHVAARSHEVVYTLLAVIAFWLAIVRPWRRERRFTFDGIAFVALFTMWWIQDPFPNYGQIVFTYNADLVNLGCPQCFLPGWLSPAETFAESLGFGLMFYFGLGWFALKAGVRIMHWARNRWPTLGNLGLVLIILALAFVFDFLTESFWTRTGLYVYGGTSTGPLVLFKGHYYQLPLHEVFLAGCWYTGLVCLWYFKNDKGQTLAERGIDEVQATRRQGTGLRLLAVIGLFNASIFLCYNLPMSWVATQFNSWPKDVVDRSYFTQGICGPATPYACPNDSLPIAQNDAARVTNDGRLLMPDGKVWSPDPSRY